MPNDSLNTETTIPRRTFLATAGLALSGLSGCINVEKHFDIHTEGLQESPVFASVEMVGGLKSKVRVTLLDEVVEKVTDLWVRTNEDNRSHVELAPGQQKAEMEMWFNQDEGAKNYLTAHDGTGEQLDEIVVTIEQTSWIGGDL